MGPSFGFLTTYAEAQPGAESFVDSLAAQLTAAGAEVIVVRLVDGRSARPATGAVTGAADIGAALAGCDVVIVDPDFGDPSGVDRAVFAALGRLPYPLIVRMPTFVRAPTRHQREMFEQVCRLADAVVVASAIARRRLAAVCTTVAGRVVVISEDMRPPTTWSTLTGAGAPTIVTCGPVGPDRGLETVIDAVAALRSLDPRPRYLIVGPTDPAVLAHEGEAYRHALMARTLDRGVASMVHLTGTSPTTPDIWRHDARADLVVVTHPCPDQLRSRTVIDALDDGRPVVALVTAHTTALAAAAGIHRHVPAGDPTALARVLRTLLTDPVLVAAAKHRAAGNQAVPPWVRIAAQYQALATDLIAARRATAV